MPCDGSRRLWTGMCLCALAAGCASGPDRHSAGSYTTGGSGSYGEPASAAVKKEARSFFGLFASKKQKTEVSQSTHLAYAQYEEQRGHKAAAANAQEEQRAAYAAARKSYESVLAADAKSIDAIIGLARLDEVAGRVSDAELGFQRAARLDGNSPRSLDALGQFYAGQGRWAEAVATFQRALSTTPDDRTVRFHYAVALAKSGQIDQAQPHLVEAVGPAAAHYNLGVILHDRGDLVRSEEHLVAAILENPRLDDAQKWLKEVRRAQQEQRAAPASAEASAAGARAVTPEVRPGLAEVAPAGAQAAANPPAASRPVQPIRQTSPAAAEAVQPAAHVETPAAAATDLTAADPGAEQRSNQR